MAQLSYRETIAATLAYEMIRDERVVLFGEDTAAAGGVFKTTEGLLAQFGPRRVKDMPISELAILGMAMGMAMTGLRPIAEIMFSDFLACCWDYVANEIPKARYMSNGQITLPLVIRTLNGAGARFGAQHSQSLENWAMAVPGIKVVAPSNAADAKGLLLSAIRDPDPVIFFEHKFLLSSKCEVPEGEQLVPLGKAAVVREGSDITMIALAAMVPKALQAADTLAMEYGIDACIIDVRTLVPLDLQMLLHEAARTGRVFTIEENPRLCGWGAEIASIIQEEAFGALKQPVVRITTPHVPVPATDQLEDAVIPSATRIVSDVRKALEAYPGK